MELSETDRNRLRLWRRWDVTFDWFGYTPPMRRVHTTLLVHRHPWTTRALAIHTNLPQTSVRRQLDILDKGPLLDRTDGGVQISELGAAFAIKFHEDLVKYVRGGCYINREILDLLKRSQVGPEVDFNMLENHVWWPIIETPIVDV